MCRRTLLGHIRKTVNNCIEDAGNDIVDLHSRANKIVWEILKEIDYELKMEYLKSNYGEDGSYDAHFARFGVDKTEVSIVGNVFSGEVSINWDIFSLTGFIKREFYVPFRRKTYYVTLEDLIEQLKRRIRFYTDEEVFLQMPNSNQNIVTLYTKTYAVSFSYGLENVKDSLLLMFAMNNLNISLRKNIYSIH